MVGFARYIDGNSVSNDLLCRRDSQMSIGAMIDRYNVLIVKFIELAQDGFLYNAHDHVTFMLGLYTASTGAVFFRLCYQTFIYV